MTASTALSTLAQEGNDIATRIAELNGGIANGGLASNDLSDQRDLLLKDLAALTAWTAGLDVHVNLIPYNPIASAPELEGSPDAASHAFEQRQACLTFEPLHLLRDGTGRVAECLGGGHHRTVAVDRP